MVAVQEATANRWPPDPSGESACYDYYQQDEQQDDYEGSSRDRDGILAAHATLEARRLIGGVGELLAFQGQDARRVVLEVQVRNAGDLLHVLTGDEPAQRLPVRLLAGLHGDRDGLVELLCGRLLGPRGRRQDNQRRGERPSPLHP